MIDDTIPENINTNQSIKSLHTKAPACDILENQSKKSILANSLACEFLTTDNQSLKKNDYHNISNNSVRSPIYTEHATLQRHHRNGDDYRHQQPTDYQEQRRDYHRTDHQTNHQADHRFQTNQRHDWHRGDAVSTRSHPDINLDKASLLHEFKQLQMLNAGTTIITRE